MSKDDPAEIIQLLKDYTFNKTQRKQDNFGLNESSGLEEGSSKINISWSLILLNALDWVHEYKMNKSN